VASSEKVRLDIDGPLAVITNDNRDENNAFDDDMDVQLFDILTKLKDRPEVLAIIWRSEELTRPIFLRNSRQSVWP